MPTPLLASTQHSKSPMTENKEGNVNVSWISGWEQENYTGNDYGAQNSAEHHTDFTLLHTHSKPTMTEKKRELHERPFFPCSRAGDEETVCLRHAKLGTAQHGSTHLYKQQTFHEEKNTKNKGKEVNAFCIRVWGEENKTGKCLINAKFCWTFGILRHSTCDEQSKECEVNLFFYFFIREWKQESVIVRNADSSKTPISQTLSPLTSPISNVWKGDQEGYNECFHRVMAHKSHQTTKRVIKLPLEFPVNLTKTLSNMCLGSERFKKKASRFLVRPAQGGKE